MAIRYGTVLTFPPGLTEEEAKRLLDRLLRGERALQTSGVEEYDDRYGGPVWYVP